MPKAVFIAVALAVLALQPGAGAAAESISNRLDAAKAAHAKGDLARAGAELEAALVEIHARLGKALAEFLPPPPAGWQGDPSEVQTLGGAGGGMAVTRAYGRDDGSVNATLIINSPAVASAQAALQAPESANLKRIKLGAEDALLRWDSANRSGEVTMVLGGRVLLQVEGDNLGTADPILDVAKGWNLAGMRKLLGL